MTLRAISRSFLRHKVGNSNTPDYAAVVKYLNEIQDSMQASSRTRARLNTLLYVLLMIVSMAITLVVVSYVYSKQVFNLFNF